MRWWSLNFKALRAPFLVCSAASSLAAAALANLERGRFSWPAVLGCLVCVAAIHLGANQLEGFAAAEIEESDDGGNPAVRWAALLTGGLIAMALGAVVGLAMALSGRPQAAWWSLAGLALATVYAVNPFDLRGRWPGEVIVFLLFGPLLTLAVYHVLTHRLSVLAVLVGVPLGGLAAAAVWLNRFLDEPDRPRRGRDQPVTWLGQEWSIWVYLLIVAGSFAYLIALAFGHGLGWLIVLGLLPLPLTASGAVILIKHHWARGQIVRSRARTAQAQAAAALLVAAAMVVETVFRAY